MTTPIDSSASTDATLIALWDGFAADLKRFIVRRVDSEEDAEDILQNVFLRMLRSLDGVRNQEALIGWMYRLTRNAILDHYRAAARRREMSVDELPDLPVDAPDDDAEVDRARQELARCMRPLLATVPKDQANAVVLVDFEGMPQSAAAEVAGVSVSGMKSRVQRGRARLRESLMRCCAVKQDSSRRAYDYEQSPGCSC